MKLSFFSLLYVVLVFEMAAPCTATIVTFKRRQSAPPRLANVSYSGTNGMSGTVSVVGSRYRATLLRRLHHFCSQPCEVKIVLMHDSPLCVRNINDKRRLHKYVKHLARRSRALLASHSCAYYTISSINAMCTINPIEPTVILDGTIGLLIDNNFQGRHRHTFRFRGNFATFSRLTVGTSGNDSIPTSLHESTFDLPRWITVILTAIIKGEFVDTS